MVMKKKRGFFIMKYAMLKEKKDFYAEPIICIFENTRQRELNDFKAMKRYMSLNPHKKLDYLDFYYEDILAKDAKKIIRKSTMVFNFTLRINQYSNIKDWYTNEYVNDDLGYEIPSNLRFIDVFEALNTYKDIYKLLGNAADSIIRERIFEKLAEIIKVDYDYIYDQWLKCH